MKLDIFLSADDTKIFQIITNTHDRKPLQDDISTILNWEGKWLIEFHIEKYGSVSVDY